MFVCLIRVCVCQFVHHFLAIGVTAAVICTPAVTMYIPAFLVVECSTVFYNGTARSVMALLPQRTSFLRSPVSE